MLVSALGLSTLASVRAATTFGASKSSSFSGAKKTRAVVRTSRAVAARPQSRPKPRRVSPAPARKISKPRGKIAPKSGYQKKREKAAKAEAIAAKKLSRTR